MAVIEKSFDKLYELDAPQSTLTRIANRFLKEYQEVFNCDFIPKEIKRIYNAIKNRKSIDKMHTYEYKHELYNPFPNEHIYDIMSVGEKEKVNIIFEEQENGSTLFRVYWWFYRSVCYIKKFLRDKKEFIEYDLATLKTKVHAAKGKYRYFFTEYSPFVYSIIPRKYITCEVYCEGSQYLGEVTYDKILTQDDCKRSGLVLDTKWEDIRRRAITKLKGATAQ